MTLKTHVSPILIALALFLSPTAHAQTFSVLHAFAGAGDGVSPLSGVTVRGGALFGVTYATTPRAGTGSVFEMQRVGKNWTFAPIYVFNGDDGANPYSRVVFGPDGHLYGTTQYGGTGGQFGPGTAFQLTPPASFCKTAYCPWTRKQVFDFSDPQNSGSNPGHGDLVWDQQGNIYGTTIDGRVGPGGTVYQLIPSGVTWTETVLNWFPSGETRPAAAGGVVFDKSGNLFGTLSSGTFDNGYVYELKNVGGTWQLITLYTFSGGSDGGNPQGGLISDSAGNLYGATADGASGRGGTVYELSPSGDTWTFKVIYTFTGVLNSPCGPTRSLTFDAAGNLYGTTQCDGSFEEGNVFKLTNTQNGWVYTSLHDFTGGADGNWPFSEVAIDTDGTLYGTTLGGGNRSCDSGSGCGVVWMIKP